MTINPKKERVKLTPEQLFNLYLECNAPGAPVKMVLERYGLRPWDLIAIRKKVKSAAMEALAHPGKLGRKQQVIPVEQYQKVSKELNETKDALAAVVSDRDYFFKITFTGIIRHYPLDVKLAEKFRCGIMIRMEFSSGFWVSFKTIIPRVQQFPYFLPDRRDIW